MGSHHTYNNPLYYTYSTRVFYFGGGSNNAKLITPMRLDKEWGVYYGKPGQEVRIRGARQQEPYGCVPKLTFKIHPKMKPVDNQFTGADFTLYSSRLILLMKQYGVNFEAFPVNIIGSDGQELKDREYSIFHLLEPIQNAMDEEKSEWKGDWDIGVPRFVLDLNNFDHRPIFIDRNVMYTFMRSDLKEAIQKNNISGFIFIDPKYIKTGKYGFPDQNKAELT